MNHTHWIKVLEEYDPEVHGTSAQYCKQLGINLKTYYSRKTEYNRSIGIPSKKITPWDEVFSQFDPSRETLLDFCKRMNLNYQSAKSARHRRKTAPVRARREKIFTGDNGFFELGEVDDDLL